MQVRVPKTILMLIWTHVTMRSSQVTKLLVSNKKNFEAMAHEILDMVTGDLFEEIANRVMAENDGNEDSVMESLGADGKFACSRDATTYEGVTGEAVAFKVAPAATPTQLQQLDAFVGSTDMVGDMAMDAADLHKVGGADQEGYSTTESGAEAVSLGVVEMDGREEALVTPVKASSMQAQ